MKRKPKAYLLCATPRSGSTLLCDLLSQTQIAGHPASYFRRQDIGKWADEFEIETSANPSIDAEYLKAVCVAGTSKNGVFGARIMADGVSELSKSIQSIFPNCESDSARFSKVFGNVTYLSLVRRDTVSQAVSLAKALQTGLWHLHADGSIRQGIEHGQPLKYDAKCIDSSLQEIEDNLAVWAAWFQKEEIEPLEIFYEDLVADPQETVRVLLDELKLDQTVASMIQPGTAKMADAETKLWITRYNKKMIKKKL